MFTSQLAKIKLAFSATAIAFSSVVIFLRYYFPESIGYHHINETQHPAGAAADVPASSQHTDEEESRFSADEHTPHSLSIGEPVEGSMPIIRDWDNQQTNEEEETPSSVQSDPAEVPRNNQQNNEEGTRISVEATQHSPSIGEASGESRVSISERERPQSNEGEGSRWSEEAESRNQNEVSSGNADVAMENGWMQSNAAQGLRRRPGRMAREIENVASSVGDTPERRRCQVALPLFFF
ncbi:uncharacterized protein LOC129290832 isoform X2 [Prosopis cineraria]|uniref:uncharacterized protein LOC129290832 isoform X2 n=1 Tax=Prosopis cineraria TaxID=364024 RepID=UPI00240FF45E|nr:uncharacterized protein LOC129290832 isoform X2 [Prosopis cineraria]